MIDGSNRLTPNAILPTRGTALAAGYDLSSAYGYTVKARGKELVKTDLAIKVPSGTYGRIAPRSGLAWKNSIDVGAGVIDEDYRGNVGIILFNHSDQDFKISPGDRVAQLILEKIAIAEIADVGTNELPSFETSFETLDSGQSGGHPTHGGSATQSARGEGGFGSTGIASIPVVKK